METHFSLDPQNVVLTRVSDEHGTHLTIRSLPFLIYHSIAILSDSLKKTQVEQRAAQRPGRFHKVVSARPTNVVDEIRMRRLTYDFGVDGYEDV